MVVVALFLASFDFVRVAEMKERDAWDIDVALVL
jgi:hypothetical protein